MRKIPTLYARDPETNLRHVRNEVHPDCQWVLDGEGTATYKWDGTAVLIDVDGGVWKRREVKSGKPIPDGFRQEGDGDPVTGKTVGWVPVSYIDPADRWLREAVEAWPDGIPAGTYELVGPKVQGNPHGFDAHQLIPHGLDRIDDIPTEFDALGRWLHRVRGDDTILEDEDGALLPPGFEGVVWHHPDGRMAKIKVRDFPPVPAAAG